MNNEVFANFAFYSTIVVLKMIALALMTSKTRLAKQVFATEVDCKYVKEGLKPILNDPDVERVRRNHLNDIENIIPFVIIGSFYTAINPDPMVALWHFRIFVGSRFLHTIFYQHSVPQPSRGLAYMVGLGVTLSMAVQVLLA